MALWPHAAAGIAELTHSNTSYTEGLRELPKEGAAVLSNMEVSAWAILVVFLYAIYRYQRQPSRATTPQHACLKEKTLESRRVLVANASAHALPAAAMQRRAEGARTMDCPAKPKKLEPAYPESEAFMLQREFRFHACRHKMKHNMKDMLHTLETLDGMPEKVPASMYCIAIKELAKQGDAVSAHRWLLRAIDKGHVPHNMTFNAVINSYTKHGNMKSAMRVVQVMKSAGVSLDTMSYNAIILAWAQMGDVDNAQLWMERMVAENVQPSSVSFGFVFAACARAGQLDALEAWFLSSQKRGIQLEVKCLSSVAHILLEKGELDSASKWITRIIDTGADPGPKIMLLLRYSVTDGNYDRVVSVLQHMRAANMVPDATMFSQMVIGAIKVGCLEQAQEWADECIAHKKDLSKEAHVSMIGAGLRSPLYTHSVQKAGSVAQADKPAEAQESTQVDFQVLDAPEELEDKMLGSEGRNVKVARTASVIKGNVVFAHGGKNTPKNVEDQVAQPPGRENQAVRNACMAQRHTGVILEFVPQCFGHIFCKETFNCFGRDVYLAAGENPQGFAKGQRIEFSVRVDLIKYQPSAYDVKAWRPSD